MRRSNLLIQKMKWMYGYLVILCTAQELCILRKEMPLLLAMAYRPTLLLLQNEGTTKILHSNFKFLFRLLQSVKLLGLWLEVQGSVPNSPNVFCRKFYLHDYHHELSTHIMTCSDPNFSWVVVLKEFAHPPEEVPSAMQTVGPTFFLATSMFGFVFQMSSLITEKELKLRQVMTINNFSWWMSG